MNKEKFLSEVDINIKNSPNDREGGILTNHPQLVDKLIPLNGLISCRATAFRNECNVGLILKKNINLEKINDWFEIGYKLFKVPKNEKIEVIELSKYYIFYFKFRTAGAPVCQWFLFPGYKYFEEFYKLFKQITQGSKLDVVQACKVAFIIMSKKDTNFRSNFGYKFPFVVEYQSVPLVAGDPTFKNFSKSHVQIYLIPRSITSEDKKVGMLHYDFNIEDKTFEEIYLDSTKWLLGRVLFDAVVSLKKHHSAISLIPFSGSSGLDTYIPNFSKLEIKMENSKAYVDLYSIVPIMKRIIKKSTLYNSAIEYLEAEIKKFEK